MGIMPESDEEAWDEIPEHIRARMPWLSCDDFTMEACPAEGHTAEAYEALKSAQDELRSEGVDPHNHGPAYRALRNWR